MMEMQPIALTRLIDESQQRFGERREDPKTAAPATLSAASRMMLAQLAKLRAEITQSALNHLTGAEADALAGQLELIKDNVRDALQAVSDTKLKEPRYG